MLPTTANPNVAPYEHFLGKKPDISHLRVFGCVAYVHQPRQLRSGAWTPKASRMIFLGYGQLDGTKDWVFYDPIAKKRVVSVYAEFWEHVQWEKDEHV